MIVPIDNSPLNSDRRALFAFYCEGHGTTQVGEVLLEKSDDSPGEFWIWSVQIFPEFRGKGLSKLLIEDAIAEILSKQAQVRSIKLRVFYSNIPAVRTYKKCGFAHLADHGLCQTMELIVQ